MSDRQAVDRSPGGNVPDLLRLSAEELAAALRHGDYSPTEAVEAHLAQIERVDPAVNAYVEVLAERARERALELERERAGGTEPGPLYGVPVAIKDMVEMRGAHLTFGSVAFRDFVATDDDPVVARLERAGAIVLGKTNTSELGHDSVADNKLFGATSTPFAIGMNSGGSSGGSAAAVASGMAALSQGGDGGGSIRIPASCCGVYGFKGTWGRVPMKLRPNGFLHTPFVHSGPITRTVGDAALMLGVIEGTSPVDPFSLPATAFPPAPGPLDLSGLRVAYSPTFGGFAVAPEVRSVIERAVRALEAAGVRIEEVEPSWGHEVGEMALAWLRGEAALNASTADVLKRDGIDLMTDHRGELTGRLLRSIEEGLAMSAVEFMNDEVLRTDVLDVLEGMFSRYDLILTPTNAVPTVPNLPDGGTAGPSEIAGVAVDSLIGWVLTFPLNFTGSPAASAPAGLTDDGLPVGLQIVGRRFEDATVLAFSEEVERVLPWRGRLDAVLDRLAGAGGGA